MSSGRRRLPRRPALRSTREGRDRSALRTPREELAEATVHGQVYLRRLRRAQLSLSVMALVAFGALFGALPFPRGWGWGWGCAWPTRTSNRRPPSHRVRP